MHGHGKHLETEVGDFKKQMIFESRLGADEPWKIKEIRREEIWGLLNEPMTARKFGGGRRQDSL